MLNTFLVNIASVYVLFNQLNFKLHKLTAWEFHSLEYYIILSGTLNIFWNKCDEFALRKANKRIEQIPTDEILQW